MPRDFQTIDLQALRNLGPKTVAMLAQIGVRSAAELRRRGAVATYVALKRANVRTAAAVTVNALYSLVGALEGGDWREVKRARKLELLLAVEDYERMAPAPATRASDELLALRNIGPAMRRDFALLGISTRAQLARRDADRLYAQLQQLTGTRHDPCVWDTFAAAIHQARTGEALPWWHFTRERKRRQAEGAFSRARPRRLPRSAI